MPSVRSAPQRFTAGNKSTTQPAIIPDTDATFVRHLLLLQPSEAKPPGPLALQRQSAAGSLPTTDQPSGFSYKAH